MPLIMLGIAILGFGIMVVRGDVHIPTALVLLLVAAYGGNILYSEQQSETLVLDKTAVTTQAEEAEIEDCQKKGQSEHP